MRISDWSSDVCSSDLLVVLRGSASGATTTMPSGERTLLIALPSRTQDCRPGHRIGQRDILQRLDAPFATAPCHHCVDQRLNLMGAGRVCVSGIKPRPAMQKGGTVGAWSDIRNVHPPWADP